MLRQPRQPPDVFPDQLRRAVVVVEDGEHAAEDGMVSVPQADVEREERVDDVEDEDVQLCLEERPHGARFAG